MAQPTPNLSVSVSPDLATTSEKLAIAIRELPTGYCIVKGTPEQLNELLEERNTMLLLLKKCKPFFELAVNTAGPKDVMSIITTIGPALATIKDDPELIELAGKISKLVQE